jgi:hypothetical protein
VCVCVWCTRVAAAGRLCGVTSGGGGARRSDTTDKRTGIRTVEERNDNDEEE